MHRMAAASWQCAESTAIAHHAEALGKRPSAEFLAAGYEEETLFKADFARMRAERRRS